MLAAGVLGLAVCRTARVVALLAGTAALVLGVHLPGSLAQMGSGEEQPRALRGVYLPAGRLLGGVDESLWQQWRRVGLNALVVDLKNDQGWVLAPVGLAEVGRFQARWSPGLDLAGLAERAKSHGLYPVARIVALRDDRAARARPDLALKDRKGEVWRGPSGERWLDPTRPEVQRYIAGLALAARAMGFVEVQLDYARFPSEGEVARLPWPNGTKSEAVRSLVAAVQAALAGTGTLLSLAVFGQACTWEVDMGIGQQCESLAAVTDLLAPMAYPSHYAGGSFGLARPERCPGATVEQTLRRTTARIGPQRVRPWLQAFTLRVSYGPAQLAEQIRAAEAAGTAGWFLWNPRGLYPYLQAAMEDGVGGDPPGGFGATPGRVACG